MELPFGPDVGHAAETLSEMGYTDIVDLDCGMNAWTDAELELLTDPQPGAEAPD